MDVKKEKHVGGFSLFPPPPSATTTKKPFRNFSNKREAGPSVAVETGKSQDIQDGRQSAMSGGRHSMIEGRMSAAGDYAVPTAITRPDSAMSRHYVPSANHAETPTPNDLRRSHTSFSEAPTLTRSHSNASHSSIAKPKLYNTSGGGDPAMIRSIFPRYNPELPLEHQPYFPTQASPTHIPKTQISRSPYSPNFDSRRLSGPGMLRSPLSAPATVTTFSRNISGLQENVTRTVTPSTTEELKQLWKVLNGWRVSPSEGRSFCLKMNSEIDVPVHTLSSDTQPFYTLRLDPTSTSAQMTLTRQDPYKGKGSSPRIGDRSSKMPATGIEVLRTTMEEPARRLPPNDGLVALLYPEAASGMALDLMTKPGADPSQIMATAEHECARLVWDTDNKTYYLCHPAMTTPFSIQIESSPAWSRMEYTLEHPELRNNLVKLTRDGLGGGYLEVDTGVAAMVESFYIVDVAICAVLLVAIEEEKRRSVERFEAPPTVTTALAGKTKDIKTKKTPKIEEMEIDLESQTTIDDKKGKLPGPTRGVLGCLFMVLKCIVWMLTLVVNLLAKMIIGMSTCLSKS